MGLIGGTIASLILNRFIPSDFCEGNVSAAVYQDLSSNKDATEFPYRLQHFFGEEFCREIYGKTVADFGCGSGRDIVEMVLRGAEYGIGLEIREELFIRGKKLAEQYGVADKCIFKKTSKSETDIIISVDAFEHFDNPEAVLLLMSQCLKPGGVAWISFGPLWYHPRGGHLFSVFPWAHLIFTEKALIRWRSKYKTDGAKRFSEVAGGLNQISISRFRKIVKNSPFEVTSLRCIPIKGIRAFDNPLTREFLTSCVQCRLRLK